MSERTIPPELRPKNTRDSKEWHKTMMDEYKRMSENFKNNIVSEDNNKLKIEELHDEFLTFKETDVFDFFSKAKNEMNKIKKNNDDISEVIKEYESFKTDINKFNDLVKEANNIYDNLSTKTQISDIKHKLIISQNILLKNENKTNIRDFETSIDEKIIDLNNRLTNNNNRLSNFKKLVMKCMGNEKIDYNMCNVCVTNKINICINPCGHTFCSVCVEKMNSKCGMCRGKIDAKIKMYIENDDKDDDEIVSANINNDLDGNTIQGWDHDTSIIATSFSFSSGGFGW